MRMNSFVCSLRGKAEHLIILRAITRSYSPIHLSNMYCIYCNTSQSQLGV